MKKTKSKKINNFIKSFKPHIIKNPHDLKKIKYLKFLHKYLNHPALWNLNRKSVLRSIIIGPIVMMIPLPIHILLATILSIFFKANVSISLLIIFITNPLTIPFIFYPSYLFGCFILSLPMKSISEFEFSEKIFTEDFPALFTGSILAGIIISITCYFIVSIYWKNKIISKFKNRNKK